MRTLVGSSYLPCMERCHTRLKCVPVHNMFPVCALLISDTSLLTVAIHGERRHDASMEGVSLGLAWPGVTVLRSALCWGIKP